MSENAVRELIASIKSFSKIKMRSSSQFGYTLAQPEAKVLLDYIEWLETVRNTETFRLKRLKEIIDEEMSEANWEGNPKIIEFLGELQGVCQ